MRERVCILSYYISIICVNARFLRMRACGRDRRSALGSDIAIAVVPESVIISYDA